MGNSVRGLPSQRIPVACSALSFGSGRQGVHSWIHRPGAQNSHLDKEEIRKLATFR